MKIRKLISVGLFLGVSGGMIVEARPSCYGQLQDNEHRPKFYAIRVVSEKNVQSAKDSLGAPDGRYAEILPGGQLVLLMEKELCLFPVADGHPVGGVVAQWDSGSFVGKGEADVGLEVWSPWEAWEDEVNKQHHDWMAMALSATGFILPKFYTFKSTTGMDMVRITNLGAKSLFMDTVIGYAMEAETR